MRSPGHGTNVLRAMVAVVTGGVVARLAPLVMAVVVAVLATGSTSSAQSTTTAREPVAADIMPPSLVDYQLGPGDLITIGVSGLREFENSTRVSNSGRIRVPYVGVIFVAGMTTAQVEKDVARLIKEHELINEPTVRIQVLEYRARPTYVVGDVTAPGQFMITGEMYLLDLLSKAGGLLLSADDVGYLYRRSWPQASTSGRLVGLAGGDDSAAGASHADPVSPTPPPLVGAAKNEEVIKIDFEALKRGTNPALNVRLQGGDILFVPRRRASNFYVIGDVKVPGGYTLPRRGQVTAAQAVIYAGGTLRTAKTGKGFLVRHDTAGNRVSVPLDFSAILAGKTPDFPIQANDIIFIPTSGAKTIGFALLDMVPELVRQWMIF